MSNVLPVEEGETKGKCSRPQGMQSTVLVYNVSKSVPAYLCTMVDKCDPASMCHRGFMQRDADTAQGRKQARVPVYLNDSRQTLLFDIDLAAQPSVEQSVWQQRGVAVIAWST